MVLIAIVFRAINPNQTIKDVVRTIFPLFIFISSMFFPEIKLIAKSKLQAVDVHTYGVACNPKLTNGDCQVFFGEAAICRNDSCYCDRERSYVHNNRCGNDHSLL